MFCCNKLWALIDGYGEKRLGLKEKQTGRDHWQLLVEENEYVKGTVDVFGTAQSYVLKMDIECIPYPYDYYRAFNGKESVGILLELVNNNYKGVGVRKLNPFWNEPVFWEEQQILQNDVQQLIVGCEGEYVHIMPLSNESLQCSIAGTKQNEISLTISTYCGGISEIAGAFAIISKAENPHKAVSYSYDTAYKYRLLMTRPRSLKPYPKELEGLGWCTWNAFYHDVTAEGIEKKLMEFQEKKIPVKWIIIDDGWSQVQEFKLVSFYEDKAKFPEGLKTFISRVKKKYGIRYVGVWHSFTGYWFGIEPGSEVAIDCKDILSVNNAGLCLPAGKEEAAFIFYDKWHTYLKAQGVDFLKVDCQGNAFEFYQNTPNVCSKVTNLHKALEKSVKKHFGGAMINCMGMANLDMYSRSDSAVIRNSDDFYPDKDGFENHILQNAYNTVFNAYLYYCDFDMWWTNQTDTKRSSVLRAISGGPIYISDKIGDTKDQYLKLLMDENGDIVRCNAAAVPTMDCLFTDPRGGVLKLFNRMGKNYVLAVYNLSDKEQEVNISLSDMYITGDDVYLCGGLFLHQRQIMKPGDVMRIKVQSNDVELVKCYKMTEGKVPEFDFDRYI